MASQFVGARLFRTLFYIAAVLFGLAAFILLVLAPQRHHFTQWISIAGAVAELIACVVCIAAGRRCGRDFL